MSSESKPFLPSNDSNIDLEYPDFSRRHEPDYYPSWKRSAIQLVATFLIAIILGFFLGRNTQILFSQKPKYGGLLPPDGHITEVWEHNLTFSQAPTLESEAAWDTMIPPGRGFITQPDIAPFISNIAAFHQMHCLHAILTAYYATKESLESVAAGEDLGDGPELFGARIETKHIRHCFDYLRRSIMCAADTNLEVVDRVKHQTNGWGQKKTCRDFNSVVQYARRWANSTDTGIVTGNVSISV